LRQKMNERSFIVKSRGFFCGAQAVGRGAGILPVGPTDILSVVYV